MLQLVARGSPPAAAVRLAAVQPRGEVGFAPLRSNPIDAAAQRSIAHASVEIYHIG